MIKATFLMNSEKQSLSLKITGHAKQAEKGQDIICSAASILAYTLAQNVNFAYKQRQLKAKPVIKLNEGDTVISCKAKEDGYATLLHAYFVIQVGYQLLAQDYPDYVTVVSLGNKA